jgi:hypothetical protein
MVSGIWRASTWFTAQDYVDIRQVILGDFMRDMMRQISQAHRDHEGDYQDQMMKQTIGVLAIVLMLMTIVGTVQAQEWARHETVTIHADTPVLTWRTLMDGKQDTARAHD